MPGRQKRTALLPSGVRNQQGEYLKRKFISESVTASRIQVVAILFFAFFFACSATAAEKSLVAPAKAKCPVCGMFVAKYTEWVCSIGLKDGTTAYFDGPKDLFKFYLNPARYGAPWKQADIGAIQVRDYYSLASVDGRQAYFVFGSDVFGPMGKELIPFAKKADAEGFLKDHGGKRIVRFGEITQALMKSLE
jgi:copper chaperone NosL